MTTDALTTEALDAKIEAYLDEAMAKIEAHAAHVLFRLERIEQALLKFAAENGSNPTMASQELGRILRLAKADFTDANLR